MMVVAIITLLLGLLLILSGRRIRSRRGLTNAATLDLDGRNLYSARYHLAGRPDRVIKGNIPEEWKSSLRVYDSHRAQLAVYFILIEEEIGVRPTHGFIGTGDGRREKVENSDQIRAWVLGIADEIRAARRRVRQTITVNPPPAKCHKCGMRAHCGQRTDSYSGAKA